MTPRNHPSTRLDRTTEQSPAEQQEAAQRLYKDAENRWFPNLRNSTNNDQLQNMLSNFSVGDYSALAQANDRDQRRLNDLNNQLKPLAQTHGDANVQANQAAQSQAPQDTNPVEQQVMLMKGQVTKVEDDYHQIDKVLGTGQNGIYTYNQIEKLANHPASPMEVAAQPAAQELLGLYQSARFPNFATSHVSDFADLHGSMSWDSVLSGASNQTTQIDAVENKYKGDSSAFHTISVIDNNAIGLLPTDVTNQLRNNDPAIQGAAGNLNPGDNHWDHRWQNPNNPMITQNGIDRVALIDLHNIDLPVSQPKVNAPAASGAAQNPDGINNPPGQTDQDQLMAQQTRLTKLTGLESQGLQINPQINDNLGRVISGGGYYQVAERLLGITDLRKRPTAAQAKELNLLTGILEKEASKSNNNNNNNNNNGAPRHLKAGQSLLSADNIRDAMDQLDAIIEATRTDRPTPPATPAINA